MDALIPVIVTFVILLIAFVAVGFFLRRLATQNEAAARAKYPAARLVVPDAVFFGQESRGMAQLRGNGTLVISDSELYFRKWVPLTEYTIPLNRIESIESPKVYLGKSYGRPLLKINYRREDGQSDSMGWYVPDVESVRGQVDVARGVQS